MFYDHGYHQLGSDMDHLIQLLNDEDEEGDAPGDNTSIYPVEPAVSSESSPKRSHNAFRLKKNNAFRLKKNNAFRLKEKNNAFRLKKNNAFRLKRNNAFRLKKRDGEDASSGG